MRIHSLEPAATGESAILQMMVLPRQSARWNIFIAVIGSIGLSFLFSRLLELMPGSFLNGWEGVAGLFGGLAIWSYLDNRAGTELTFSEEGVTARRRGKEVWRLTYNCLLEFRLEYEGLGHGIKSMTFSHPEGKYRVKGTFRLERRFAGRAIGILRRRSPNTQIRGFRTPEDGRLAAFLFDRQYVLEPMAMEEGRTYRYRFAPEMKARWKSDAVYLARFAAVFFLVTCAVRVTSLGVVVGVLTALFLVYGFGPGIVFSRSFDDRFTVTAEGLRVTRGNKGWLFTDPRPCEEAWYWLPEIGLGLVEYRKGLRRYYVDPRLIEEEA